MDEPSKPEVGIIKRGRIKRLFKPTKKQLLVLIPILVCVIVAASYLVFTTRTNNDEGHTVTLPSEQTALAGALSKLQSNKPSESANIQEKTKYYDQLFYVQYESKDYVAAGATFTQREELSKEGLTYYDYFTAASVYKKIGDKDKALTALDRSEALVPADNPEEGFFRGTVIDAIKNQRQELLK